MPRMPEASRITPLEGEMVQACTYYDEIFDTSPPIPVGEPDLSDIRRAVRNAPPSAPGYAFERVTANIADVRMSRHAGRGPILIVDPCSSIPLLIERARAGEFSLCGTKARGLINDCLLNDDVLASFRDTQDETAEFFPVENAMLHNAAARDLLAGALQEFLYGMTIGQFYDRGVLRAALRDKLLEQRICYRLDEKRFADDVEGGWRIRFTLHEGEDSYLGIVSNLLIQTSDALAAGALLAGDAEYSELVSSAKDWKRFGKRWGVDAQNYLSTHEDYAPLARMAKERAAAGEASACRFIDWQVDVLARQIYDNQSYRPVRFISMDMLDPDEIAVSSCTNTPHNTQRSNLFARAVYSIYDPLLHVQGNLLAEDGVPFPENSITLMTIYDGWPFNIELDVRERELSKFTPLETCVDYSREDACHEDEISVFMREAADMLAAVDGADELITFAREAADTLERLYDLVAYGGELVIFPWAIKDSKERGGKVERLIEMMLKVVVEEVSRRTGQGLDLRVMQRDVLDSWMSSSDRAVSENASSIFGAERSYQALIIRKPRESLARRANRPTKVAKTAGGLATQARIRD